MFAFLDSPVEIGIIVLVVLLLFGGSQLPKLAKNLGQAQKEFKDGLAAGQQTDAAKGAAKDAAASAQVAQASAAQAVAAAPQIPVVPPPAAVPMNERGAGRGTAPARGPDGRAEGRAARTLRQLSRGSGRHRARTMR